jgi:hypothetical protein
MLPQSPSVSVLSGDAGALARATNSSNRNYSQTFLSSLPMKQHVTDVKAAVKRGTNQIVFNNVNRRNASSTVSPYYHYHCDVIVCVPHLNMDLMKHLPFNRPVCPSCLSYEFVNAFGWYDSLSYVNGIKRHAWYMTYKYECKNTIHQSNKSVTFSLTDKGFELLPDVIKQYLPITRVNKYWYTKELIDYILLHRLSTS